MSGRPTLVLLPGMDGTGRLFDRFRSALPTDVSTEVVAYPSDRTTDLEALANLVRRRLPVDRPFVLVAESFSGPVAVRVAADGPPRLAGLVLCASFVTPPVTGAAARLAALGAPVAFSLPPPAFVVRRWMTGGVDGGLVGEVRAAVARVRRGVLLDRLRLMRRVDLRAELSRLAVPVLALRASEDRIVRDAIEGVEEELVEGPHLLLQARPGECARIVVEFSDRVG